MTDTAYQIFKNGYAYKVRITRLGNFVQEADGFVLLADAESRVAEDRRLAVMDERKEPPAGFPMPLSRATSTSASTLQRPDWLV